MLFSVELKNLIDATGNKMATLGEELISFAFSTFAILMYNNKIERKKLDIKNIKCDLSCLSFLVLTY